MRPTKPTIRQASPDEAQLLTTLTLQSKAYWGYDAEFMATAVAELTITPEYIAQYAVFILQAGDDILGYCSLVDHGDELLLDNLFIAPEYIGKGYGSLLWHHTVDQARLKGYQAILLDADPNAAPFYEKLGAVQFSEVPSNIQPGRTLPRMRFSL